MEEKFSKSTTTEGRKTSSQARHHCGEITDLSPPHPTPAAAFNSAGDTESWNITALQPSQQRICMREIKVLLTSGLAEGGGGSSMCQGKVGNSDCGGPSVQCSTAGGHQPAGRASHQQLWRFPANLTGSEEQRAPPPSGGDNSPSHM